MLKIKILIPAILCCFATMARAGVVVKAGNMVTINIETPQGEGAKIVCLQVVNDNIIRVRATSEDALPEKKSLMVVPQKGSPGFDVNEDAQKVYVKTRKVQAVVDKQNGDVAFFDANGKQTAPIYEGFTSIATNGLLHDAALDFLTRRSEG